MLTPQAPNLLGALCVGKWELFDSTESLSHHQAAKLCRSCPVLDACTVYASELQRDRNAQVRPLTGTWAGRLYGANRWDPSRLAREEAMFTDIEAGHAHAAWGRGERNDRIEIGERVYQRRQKRAQKARRDAAELVSAGCDDDEAA